jgi:hypothetical protein
MNGNSCMGYLKKVVLPVTSVIFHEFHDWLCTSLFHCIWILFIIQMSIVCCSHKFHFYCHDSVFILFTYCPSFTAIKSTQIMPKHCRPSFVKAFLFFIYYCVTDYI